MGSQFGHDIGFSSLLKNLEIETLLCSESAGFW
jgi:hypothetical protein